MSTSLEDYRSGAIRPMQCLSEAWEIVKSDYWFFLGVCLVGVFVGSMAQLFLMGPMMCGIYLVILRRMSGHHADFGMLFKGFDFFLPSFVVMCIMTAISLVMVFGSYVIMGAGIFGIIAAFGPQDRRGPPDPMLPISIFALIGVVVFAIMAMSFLIHALFMFAFPLIVDRKVNGWEAVKLSSRAVFGNLFGVIGLTILSTIMIFLGLLLCYVGAIFELPLTFAMTMVAYRQAFPDLDRQRRLDALEREDEDTEDQLAGEARPASTDYKPDEQR